MDALLCRYSVLDHLRFIKKSNLSRIIIFAVTTLTSDKVLKFFNQYAIEDYADRVTGLTLVYPNYIVHLVESSEDTLFQICSYLINVEPKIFEITKYFYTEMSIVEERFFDKCYARRVIDDFSKDEEIFSTINEQIDDDNFERVTKIYRRLTKDLYILFNELRDARTTSRVCLTERLDKIVTLGDYRLPRENIIGYLVESRWGESLEKLVKNYFNEIFLKDIDDEIWPFPENQFPRIETRGNI